MAREWTGRHANEEIMMKRSTSGRLLHLVLKVDICVDLGL